MHLIITSEIVIPLTLKTSGTNANRSIATGVKKEGYEHRYPEIALSDPHHAYAGMIVGSQQALGKVSEANGTPSGFPADFLTAERSENNCII